MLQMSRFAKRMALLCAVVVVAMIGLACVFVAARTRPHWDAQSAATYLDRREKYWAWWPESGRGQGTFCVSCHSVMPYAFARPALSAKLGQATPAPEETQLLANVTKRVRLWKDIRASNGIYSYYTHMQEKALGTEAVLNALILSGHDAQTGTTLSPDTRAAFDILWEQQQTAGNLKGAWAWILFDNEPWEAADSTYYGACLAAIATGIAPENYAASPAIQPRLDLVRAYLQHNAAAQTPINRVNLLYASTKLPNLLTPAQQQSIVEEILAKQQSDGGWNLASLSNHWQREDATPQITSSDGYSTGIIVLTLQSLGTQQNSESVSRGLAWLSRNQSRWEGNWSAYSLNKRRHNPYANVARFMDDAATAYAVLALTYAENHPATTAPHSN
jgi:squalene-hopene/tetraprenyl-beta-curcumene cyclase